VKKNNNKLGGRKRQEKNKVSVFAKKEGMIAATRRLRRKKPFPAEQGENMGLLAKKTTPIERTVHREATRGKRRKNEVLNHHHIIE